MLVIPIIKDNELINIRIKLKLKTITKIHKKVNIANIKSNDILIGEKSFLESIYNTKNQEAKNVIDFIRNNSIYNQDDFLVTTKFSSTSPYYDLYQIRHPLTKVTNGLDNLYGSILLDIKNEIPEHMKTKYIDLKKLGVTEHITDEKLEHLEYIADLLNKGQNNDYQKMIKESNLVELLNTIEFLDLFDFELVEDANIEIENYEKVLTSLNILNSKEGKDLKNLYQIAKNNQEVYRKIARLYTIVFNEPLNWINHSKEKTKRKTKQEINRKVA